MIDLSAFYAMMRANMDKLQEIEKIRDFRNALMDCETQTEVTNLVQINNDFLNENPALYRAVKYARMRIARVRNEKRLSFKNMMN